MALQHAKPHEVITLAASELEAATSHALIKAGSLELVQMLLADGDITPEHSVDAEMTVHCVNGRIRLRLVPEPGDFETSFDVGKGELVLLSAKTRYSIRAVGPTSLLLTITLPYAGSASATSPG